MTFPTITTEQAVEVLNSAEAGYQVEIWLPDNGLTIVEHTREGDFNFTHWATYEAACVPVQTLHGRGSGFMALCKMQSIRINV